MRPCNCFLKLCKSLRLLIVMLTNRGRDAVMSLRKGDNVKTVQACPGHPAAAVTLDVYGHVSERMKEDGAARMQAHFRITEQIL